jgi:hypothetical protein
VGGWGVVAVAVGAAMGERGGGRGCGRPSFFSFFWIVLGALRLRAVVAVDTGEWATGHACRALGAVKGEQGGGHGCRAPGVFIR